MDINEEQNENITQETVNNIDEIQESSVPEDNTNQNDLIEKEDKSSDEEEIEFDDNIDIDALQMQLKEQINQKEDKINNENASEENNETVSEEDKSKNNDREEEIEFDDNIDIDALQNKLQEQMQNNGIVYNPAEGKKNVADEEKTSSQKENKKEVKKEISALKKRLLEKRENYKKYVIYVSEENVEYIDSLSIQDRKKIINDILHDRDVIAKRTRRFKENAKFTNQILIMIFTVVLALPVFFFLLNKSIETTILNYQQAQQNFVKLYREQGKIKNYKNFGSKY